MAEIPKQEETQTDKPPPTGRYYTGEFVEVFQTLALSDILAVQSVFNEAGIPNNFSDGFVLGAYPGRLARFFVPTEFEARALDIIKSLGLNTESSS